MSQSMEKVRSAATALPNGQLPLEGIATAGQPDRSDVARLAEAGYKVVIDLRAPGEPRGFDEAAEIQAAGMEYINLPVSGPPADETFEHFREILRDSGNRPALVHCGSANRVGALMIPYLILDLKQGERQALDAAAKVGLRSQELADQALDYVGRNRK